MAGPRGPCSRAHRTRPRARPPRTWPGAGSGRRPASATRGCSTRGTASACSSTTPSNPRRCPCPARASSRPSSRGRRAPRRGRPPRSRATGCMATTSWRTISRARDGWRRMRWTTTRAASASPSPAPRWRHTSPATRSTRMWTWTPISRGTKRPSSRSTSSRGCPWSWRSRSSPCSMPRLSTPPAGCPRAGTASSRTSTSGASPSCGRRRPPTPPADPSGRESAWACRVSSPRTTGRRSTGSRRSWTSAGRRARPSRCISTGTRIVSTACSLTSAFFF